MGHCLFGATPRFDVSGYAHHFARIGARLGPFAVALVKIGAHAPGASGLNIHMSPEDAVRARREMVVPYRPSTSTPRYLMGRTEAK